MSKIENWGWGAGQNDWLLALPCGCFQKPCIGRCLASLQAGSLHKGYKQNVKQTAKLNNGSRGSWTELWKQRKCTAALKIFKLRMRSYCANELVFPGHVCTEFLSSSSSKGFTIFP